MAEGKVHVLDHPLIQDKLTRMRDLNTQPPEFRRLLRELSMLMGYEITRPVPTREVDIDTPLAPMRAPVIDDKAIVITPILRAGLGMSDGLLALVPTAHVGHIGLYRDPETKQPREYYAKMPKLPGAVHLLVDPMLATGNSAAHAVDVMNRHGVDDSQIRFMVLVAAPEGIATFHEAHPNIDIYVAAIDTHLNEKAYIVPGLGDAGDRIFGTLD